jgi:two-component system sensor histidine kinase ChiS
MATILDVPPSRSLSSASSVAQARWLRLLVLCAAGCCWGLRGGYSAAHEQPRFRHVTIDDGLSQGMVNCILQDRQGFMWFGTKDGLNRYDGYQFTVFNHDPNDESSLSSNLVGALVEDEAGVLWIGTAAGLDRLDLDQERCTRVLPGSAGTAGRHVGSITALWLEGELLWLGTEHGELLRYRPSSDRVESVWSAPQQRANLAIHAIFRDSRERLWVASEVGLYRHDAATDQLVTGFDGLLDAAARSVFEDSDGDLWVGTLSGVNRFDEASGVFVGVPITLTASEAESGSGSGIAEDRFGRLWIATGFHGLARYDKREQRMVVFNHDSADPTSLIADGTRSILTDHSGVVWIGTNGNGISTWDRGSNRFRCYRHHPDPTRGLAMSSVRAILVDGSGSR